MLKSNAGPNANDGNIEESGVKINNRKVKMIDTWLKYNKQQNESHHTGSESHYSTLKSKKKCNTSTSLYDAEAVILSDSSFSSENSLRKSHSGPSKLFEIVISSDEPNGTVTI